LTPLLPMDMWNWARGTAEKCVYAALSLRLAPLMRWWLLLFYSLAIAVYREKGFPVPPICFVPSSLDWKCSARVSFLPPVSSHNHRRSPASRLLVLLRSPSQRSPSWEIIVISGSILELLRYSTAAHSAAQHDLLLTNAYAPPAAHANGTPDRPI
jgi:hypothetical protein